VASEFSLAALARALETVSADLKREVGLLIPAAADAMVARLESRYPLGKHHDPRVPHMRDDIRTRRLNTQDPLIPARRVIGPRLAYIWQDGTKDRVDATRRNARRGRMPAADPKFFERTAEQTRTQMLQQAEGIVHRPRELG
jgi:NADPH-dependent ferric siderophore reductase